VICGPNNVGKTNILRALNLFFYENFDADSDIPYHIAEGSRGQGYKTIIEVDFLDVNKKERIHIKKEFTRKKVSRGKIGDNIITRSGYRHILRTEKRKLTNVEIEKFLAGFWYIFVEASNINLPQLINEVVKNDVLAVGLDRLRKRQDVPLKILEKFTTASDLALVDVKNQIGSHFKEFVKLNSAIKGIKAWEIQINFPRFESLRDAISNMVTFTLHDSNNRKLDSKGSGIQRILFLSLVKYISTNTKKTVIWGLDEPEVFLQPGLQKEVFKILQELAKQLTILFTTHSHHFVDLYSLDNCFLLTADYEIKKYERRPDEEYFKVDTKFQDVVGAAKIAAIKEQMGIQGNDGWTLVPYNLLVEGQEDKDYLTALFKAFGFRVPNIFFSSGVDKMPGYLAFLDSFADGIKDKPKVLCVIDHDSAGRNKFNSLNASNYKNLLIDKVFFPRFDNLNDKQADYEVEDFVYPEIVVDAVNTILKRKNYQKLVKKDVLVKRGQPSFVKDHVLKILTNEVKNLNPTLAALNFEDLSLKIWICKEACSKIDNANVLKSDKQYPEVRVFLEMLANPK
jgi:AAA15 family ATPase/GTPase